MKIMKFYFIAFLLLSIMISCSKDQILNEIAIEKPQKEQVEDDDFTTKASCNQPSSVSNVSGALGDLNKYEYGKGSTKWEVSSVNYCKTGYYYAPSSLSKATLRSGGGSGDRSELKMNQSNDQDLSLDDYNKMEVTLKAFNIPYSSSGGGRGLTVAQLHNRGSGVSRPILRIDIVNGKLRAVVATSKSGSDADDWLLDSYSEGDRVKIKIETLGDSNRRIKYTVDNLDDSSSADSRTITLDSDWTGSSSVRDYCYFKTGCYQNTATSSGSSRPKVEIYDLDLDVDYQ